MPMPPLTKLSCKYGAPMGRRNLFHYPYDRPLKFSLATVRLNQGGYDSGGAYWGNSNKRLYRAYALLETEDGIEETDYFFRAASRAEAKDHVRSIYKKATFFR